MSESASGVIARDNQPAASRTDNGRPRPRRQPDRAGFVSRLADNVAQRLQRQIPKADLHERDPDFLRDNLPWLWLLASFYFRAEVRGLERIPPQGPVLLVGNHSGGNMHPRHVHLHARVQHVLRRRAALLPACAQPRARLAAARPAAQGRDDRGLARERASRRSTCGVGAARLSRAATTRRTALLGVAEGRLRWAQGLHPAGDREGRAGRPGGVDRRPGDGAVPHAAASGSRACCASTGWCA